MPAAMSALVASAVALTLWVAPATAQSIQNRVRKLIHDEHLGQTTFSVLIVRSRDGAELASLNADDRMIPASNMKLVTTAAALSILQSDFRFNTELRLLQTDQEEAPATPGGAEDAQETASPEKLTTLVIKGDGDPSLGDPTLLRRHDLDVEKLMDKWVGAVRDAGVTRIDRLAADDRVFDRKFIHETWPTDQLRYRYCAQVAGLNFHANVVEVWPIPADVIGATPRVELRPHVSLIETSNRAQTARSDTFWVDREIGSNTLIFWGKVKNRRRHPVQVTIHDPPMFLAWHFAEALRDAGISVDRIDRIGDEEIIDDGQVLFRLHTTLYEIVRRCNSASQNLYAEALIKRLGHRYTGASGSWDNGAAAIRNFLRRRLGTSAAVIGIADGSGLSRDNRITARILVRLLRQMLDETDLGLDYRESLAISGTRGTLRKRFRPALKGRVFAKSGFINGVCALSGYVMVPGPDADDGDEAVAFSLLFNNIGKKIPIANVKRLQEKIIDLVDEASRTAAGVARKQT